MYMLYIYICYIYIIYYIYYIYIYKFTTKCHSQTIHVLYFYIYYIIHRFFVVQSFLLTNTFFPSYEIYVFIRNIST